jgi:hypothetical protein
VGIWEGPRGAPASELERIGAARLEGSGYAPSMSPSEHEQTVTAWRRAREQRLRAPDGWLALVERLSLDEGDNELPFGTLTLRDGQALLRVRSGADVRSAG